MQDLRMLCKTCVGKGGAGLGLPWATAWVEKKNCVVRPFVSFKIYLTLYFEFQPTTTQVQQKKSLDKKKEIKK